MVDISMPCLLQVVNVRQLAGSDLLFGRLEAPGALDPPAAGGNRRNNSCNFFAIIRIRAMILAMKSTIDSAYKPRAANAAGRAAREISGRILLLLGEEPSKEIPRLGVSVSH